LADTVVVFKKLGFYWQLIFQVDNPAANLAYPWLSVLLQVLFNSEKAKGVKGELGDKVVCFTVSCGLCEKVECLVICSLEKK
jgi:hypothetical protein